MVLMPHLNLSGAWRGGCHPPVLGRENYLQGERSCLIRCWAHAGASSCCLQFTSGEAVTLPLPRGSRNSWSTFQSKHDPPAPHCQGCREANPGPPPFLPWLPAPSATGLCSHPGASPRVCIPVLNPCPSEVHGLLAEMGWAGKDMTILSVPSPSSPLTMSPVPQGGFGAPSVARVLSSDVWCDGQSGWRWCRAARVGDLLQLGQQGICRGLEKSSAVPQGYKQRDVAFLPGPCFLLLPPESGGAAAGAPA